MDFWLGRWDISFAGDGEERVTGSNTVTQHGGRIFELFVAPDGAAHYVGASVTRHDRTRDVWVQEYWDNQGYRAWYEGSWQQERFVLDLTSRGGHAAGSKRLVWRDITGDSLMWDNEQTADGGRTWASTWTIAYRRSDTSGRQG
jgi:hypothetical protein